MKSSLLSNIVFVLKINFKYLPFISAGKVLTTIWDYGANLLRLFIIGLVIDLTIEYIENPDEVDNLNRALIYFGVLILLGALFNSLRNFVNNVPGSRINNQIPLRLLYQKMDQLNTADLESGKIQNLIQRYRENTWNFADIANRSFNIIGLLVISVISFVTIFVYFPQLSILIVCSALPIIFSNKYFIDKLWQLDKDLTDASRKGWGTVWSLTNPEGAKEVKQLGSSSYLQQFFESYHDAKFNGKKDLHAKWAIVDALLLTLKGVVILYGIYLLVNAISDGELSVGALSYFIGAVTTLGNNVDNISSEVSSIIGGNERFREMRSLLDYKSKFERGDKNIGLLDSPPSIEFKNVSFSYPNSEKLVIEDLNLKIEPGEKIAIVGENGAGKTTFVKLLSNIYPASTGSILINGQNIDEIESQTWFDNLGILHQDFNKYGDLTAFENIAMGRINKKLNYEEIKEAAKKADAHDFIMEFENNYSQILSERYEGGTRPSGGQWQKIGIARFFFRNAPILILDEPTSAIDAVAEANIFNRIYEFIENKTVIIISHRFSTVRNADRIIVFEKGKIVEEGSHEELLSKNGVYANSFKTQAKGYV